MQHLDRIFYWPGRNFCPTFFQKMKSWKYVDEFCTLNEPIWSKIRGEMLVESWKNLLSHFCKNVIVNLARFADFEQKIANFCQFLLLNRILRQFTSSKACKLTQDMCSHLSQPTVLRILTNNALKTLSSDVAIQNTRGPS